MVDRRKKELSQIYLERLSCYAARRSDEEGSASSWARKLGVYRTTPLRWERKQLTDGLSEENLELLAADIGEDPEQVRAWLQGKIDNPSEPISKPALPKSTTTANKGLLEVFALLSCALPEELAEVLTFCLRRLNQIEQNGGLYPRRMQPSSCTLLDGSKQEGCVMDEPEGIQWIEIGSKRHLKLKAILVETLRIKKIGLDDLESIARAMGYSQTDTVVFRSAVRLLKLLLVTTKKTVEELADLHLLKLAQFCHRLRGFEEFPVFRAICETEQTYEGDIQQLLRDINCNGALIS